MKFIITIINISFLSCLEKINKGKGAKNILTVKNDNYRYNGYRVTYLVNGSDITQLTEYEESLVVKKPESDDMFSTIDLMNDPFF
ncbi:MAG TPA: hypothetical protein PKU83_00635, partial [Chryseolinea sp.]|nr:hypothetical protein [Chryseolinea sp.]